MGGWAPRRRRALPRRAARLRYGPRRLPEGPLSSPTAWGERVAVPGPAPAPPQRRVPAGTGVTAPHPPALREPADLALRPPPRRPVALGRRLRPGGFRPLSSPSSPPRGRHGGPSPARGSPAAALLPSVRADPTALPLRLAAAMIIFPGGISGYLPSLRCLALVCRRPPGPRSLRLRGRVAAAPERPGSPLARRGASLETRWARGPFFRRTGIVARQRLYFETAVTFRAFLKAPMVGTAVPRTGAPKAASFSLCRAGVEKRGLFSVCSIKELSG